ncbi:alpha-N-acetyl-neuraminyl-2,3-beta-galactosyl-1,3-N-acetyl-galactosaminide alpha-2,6-sialyltransferase-like [Glandiceps talaboti]
MNHVERQTTKPEEILSGNVTRKPESDSEKGSENESPKIPDRTLDSVFDGFPDEYLYVNDHAKKFNLRCSDCALVSTSGQLLGTGAGAEIDNATCVIRMNAAHVEGYEKDVGSRTTLRMVSFIVIQSRGLTKKDIFGKPSYPEKTVLWSSYAPKIFPNIFKSYVNLSSHYPNTEFYYATKKQMEFTDELFQKETGKDRNDSGSWLSTGWFTMVLALHICDEIKVYGMVESDHCER